MTVDWVVLSAAAIGMGAAAVGAVSANISDLSLNIAPTYETTFYEANFTVLEGAEGVEIETVGGAAVRGDMVVFSWRAGGAEVVFGPEALGEGVTTLESFSTTSLLDWGVNTNNNEPLAVRFGDNDTAQGGFGTPLDQGVSLLLDPSDDSYSILWNGTELDSGTFDYSIIYNRRTENLLAVSNTGVITFNDGVGGPDGGPVTEIQIPDDGWRQADREGWSLSYSSGAENAGAGWMYGRGFSFSGEGY